MCDFQANTCGWDKKPDNATFIFQRHSANQLEHMNMPGPSADYQGKTDKRFMIASIDQEGHSVDNEIARFRSPIFKSSEHPVECFNFWFNFGQQGQNEYLTVSVEHEGEDPKVIWSLDQNWNTDQKWYEARVEVTPIEAAEKPEYRIVMETPKTHVDESFVAVDQFQFLQVSKCDILPAQATPTPAPTEPPGPIIECNFQNNICQWTKITSDDSGNFQWTRHNSRQLLADNLPCPPTDWDNKDNKYFMIASNAIAGPTDPKNVFAKLESPFFKASQHPVECISFWFYLGPDGQGETLTVGIQNNKNEDMKVIWVLDETWTNEAKWNKGRVEVKPEKTDEDYEFKVVVIANKGLNNQSFVVFDEVLFVGTDKCDFEPAAAKPTEAPTTTTQGPTTPAPTEPPGPVIVCDFEKNLCGWQIKPDNATFVFQRKNAKQIGDNPGPTNDYEGKDDKFFMIASLELEAANQNQIARFRSPKFKKDEHPVECFSFWFNFGVRL